jgi:hypothetical protein
MGNYSEAYSPDGQKKGDCLMSFKWIAAIVSLVYHLSTANAAVLNWELLAGQTPSLGQGFDTTSATLMADKCISGSEKTDLSAAPSTLNFDLSATRDELDERLNYDVGASFQAGVSSASLNVSSRSRTKQDAYSLAVTFIHTIPKTVEILTTTEHESVKPGCGDAYVRERVLGGQLVVTVRIDFGSKEEANAFKADAEFRSAMAKGHVSTQASNRTLSSKARVRVEARQVGGNGENLGKLLSGSNGSGWAKNCTSGNVAECNAAVDAVLAYDTTDFSKQLENQKTWYPLWHVTANYLPRTGNPEVAQLREKLARSADQDLTALSLIDRVLFSIHGADASHVEKLKSQRGEVEAHLMQLRKALRACSIVQELDSTLCFSGMVEEAVVTEESVELPPPAAFRVGFVGKRKEYPKLVELPAEILRDALSPLGHDPFGKTFGRKWPAKLAESYEYGALGIQVVGLRTNDSVRIRVGRVAFRCYCVDSGSTATVPSWKEELTTNGARKRWFMFDLFEPKGPVNELGDFSLEQILQEYQASVIYTAIGAVEEPHAQIAKFGSNILDTGFVNIVMEVEDVFGRRVERALSTVRSISNLSVNASGYVRIEPTKASVRSHLLYSDVESGGVEIGEDLSVEPGYYLLKYVRTKDATCE